MKPTGGFDPLWIELSPDSSDWKTRASFRSWGVIGRGRSLPPWLFSSEEPILVDRKKKYYYLITCGLMRTFDYMRNRSIEIILAIAFSSFVVIFPAYLRYTGLSEIDLSSTDLILENPGQDDQLDDQQHESDAVELRIVSTPHLSEAELFNPVSSFCAPETSARLKISILRC